MSIVSNVGWWTSVVLSVFILLFPTRLFTLVFIHTYFPDAYMKLRTADLESIHNFGKFIDTDPVTGVSIPHHETYEKAPFIFYVMHLLPVYFWAIAMPLQLSTSFRRRYPSWHRRVGTVTLCFSGLLLGVSGVLIHFKGVAYQTLEPVGTLTWLLGNFNDSMFLSASFLYATYKGYTAARAKKFSEHQRWMVRYASMGYSVVMQRVLLISLVIAYPYEVGDRASRNAFGYCFVVAIVLCTSAAELGLKLHFRSAKKTTKKM